jgi:hypothetical protein
MKTLFKKIMPRTMLGLITKENRLTKTMINKTKTKNRIKLKKRPRMEKYLPQKFEEVAKTDNEAEVALTEAEVEPTEAEVAPTEAEVAPTEAEATETTSREVVIEMDLSRETTEKMKMASPLSVMTTTTIEETEEAGETETKEEIEATTETTTEVIEVVKTSELEAEEAREVAIKLNLKRMFSLLRTLSRSMRRTPSRSMRRTLIERERMIYKRYELC